MRDFLVGMLAGVLLVLSFVPSRGAEITVKVSDADQQAFTNLAGAVDQCVAGLQLRGDAGMCKAIAQFATEFGAKVKAAVPTAGSNTSNNGPAITVPDPVK